MTATSHPTDRHLCEVLEAKPDDSAPPDEKHMCQACGEREATSVRCSFVPMSLAYCDECFSNGREPYGLLVSEAAMLGTQPEQLADWFLKLIAVNMPLHGKSHDGFWADVREAAVRMESMP